jgi:hypothetical protein
LRDVDKAPNLPADVELPGLFTAEEKFEAPKITPFVS